MTALGCEIGQGYAFAKAMPPDAVGEWLERQRIDDAEDGGVAADGEREREDRDGRESRTADDQTQAESDILPQFARESSQRAPPFERDSSRGAGLCATGLVAELSPRLRAGIGFRQAFTHQILRAHVEMEGELVVDVGVHVRVSAREEAKHALDASRRE